MRNLLACWLSLTWISVASSEEAKPAVKPITNADTVIAIYTEDWGRASSGEPKLVLAVWEDGHTVWSEDHVQGGPPYRSGRIDPKKLGGLISRLDRDGAFADQKLSRTQFGPDAQFTTILAKSGKKQLKMQSWHELFEANGKTVVATDHGIELLGDRRRLEVLRKQPADYLFYRLVWSEMRAEAAGLIPREGKPVDGKLVMEKGVVSWQESRGKPKKNAASQPNPLSPQQAVLRAIECMAEKGVFRRAIEIAVSTEGDTIRVLFRRPASDPIAGGGRLPAKDVWEVTFKGNKATTKVLDKNLATEPFDKKYTKEQDKKFSQAVVAALTHVWKEQRVAEKEFAIDVSKDGDSYSVLMSDVPYLPGGQRLILLSKELKVSKVLLGN